MDQKPATINRYHYEWTTNRNKDHVADLRRKLAAFDEDKARKHRRRAPLCKVCFYINSPRIACAAITARPCGACGKALRFGSTDTDVLCPGCALEMGLCRHCGGDLELKLRRKVLCDHPNRA